MTHYVNDTTPGYVELYKNDRLKEIEVYDSAFFHKTTSQNGPSALIFKKCKGNDLNESKRCSQLLMQKAIGDYVQYPIASRRDEIEGLALFLLLVNEEGKIEKIETLRGIAADIEAHCKEVIQKLPKFKAPKLKQGTKQASYIMPFRFRLQ